MPNVCQALCQVQGITEWGIASLKSPSPQDSGCVLRKTTYIKQFLINWFVLSDILTDIVETICQSEGSGHSIQILCVRLACLTRPCTQHINNVYEMSRAFKMSLASSLYQFWGFHGLTKEHPVKLMEVL